MNGGELLCRTLEALGASHVFALPGSQNVPLFEALRQSRLRTIVPTHELAASFMAAGYSRASGRVGILATIPGPGFTYALTGLAEARLDSVPLVYLVGQPARGPGQRFQLQHIDQAAIAGPLVKRIIPVEQARALPAAVAEAYELARAGEPGPVMVHIAPGAAHEDAPWPGDIAPAAPPVLQPGAVETVLPLLANARRVLLLAGQGTVGAPDALRAVAERLAAPVVATTSARGVLPEDHPLALGFDLRATDALNALAAESDLVVALGVKFSHNGAAGFRLRLPADRLLHVDASPEVLGANYPARTTLVADVPALLRALVSRLPQDGAGTRGWSDTALAEVRARIAAAPLGLEPQVHGLATGTPAELLRLLREALPRDACVVTDSGLHQMLVRRHFPVLAPRGLIVPTNFQSMGFALAAAIGAKLAAPERTVVAVIGDGGLAMCGLELVTAVRERVALPVVLFSDGKYGLIRLDQVRDHGATYGTDLPPLDPSALAAATGAGYRALEGDAAAVLRAALAEPGPTIVDVNLSESGAMRRVRAKSVARAAGRRVLPKTLVDWLRRRR
ncbi:MAG TPA: thiamine pyrophosphate-binding protein [Gemmatimonadales bacterium]|nr:thiamine pyrophosphate-binding protein [Gemmatimonadales bacterium]